MVKQLYRFRLIREEKDLVYLAVDEADGKEVWLVEINLNPSSRAKQIEKLLLLASQHSADRFTASGSFYLVARSAPEARELLAAARASLAPPPPPRTGNTAPTKSNQQTGSKIQAKKPASPRTKKSGPALMSLLVAAALVIALVVILSRPTSMPYIAQHRSSAPSEYEFAISDLTSGAVIYYTTDGSVPTTSSSVYKSPLKELENKTLIRAIAVAPWHKASTESWKFVEFSDTEIAFAMGKRYYNNKQFKQARQSFNQACGINGGSIVDDHIPAACDYLGFMLAKGLGGRADLIRANYLFKIACDSGYAAGCASAGGLEEEGGAYAAARSHYRKACDASIAEACQALHRLQ